MSTNSGNDDDRELMKRKPQPERLVNSKEAREARRKAAAQKHRITMRVDEDVLDAFKALAGDEGSYQTLINIALRQWLDAQGVRELLKEELPHLLQDAVRAGRHG